MSLIEKVEVSEAKVAANRASAQRSTGPRTPAGKRRSRLNALRHGRWATEACWSPESLRALGEDPEAFGKLVERLRLAAGPADALWEQQILDLARLYWQRRRLDGAWETLVGGQRQSSEEEAALAPLSEEGGRLLDLMEKLDRAIDRKVRILLRIRDSEERQRRWEAKVEASDNLLLDAVYRDVPKAEDHPLRTGAVESPPPEVAEANQLLKLAEDLARLSRPDPAEPAKEKIRGTKPGS